MKYPLLAALFVLQIAGYAQTTEPLFLSQPSLTPDGNSVVFSFEGDLWKASLADKMAYRLTAMQGYENNAIVSPDGKWIAFTGRQFGNADVFVIPASGGQIKQLTWFSGSDEVSSWSWDSKTIYFTSSRLSRLSSYKVTVTGGTATPVFNRHYFLYDHNVAENPATGELFFNDTWESASDLQRKGYKGAFNPDIQSYNPAIKTYKRYTSWQGKDFGATIDRGGTVYFLSDEVNGQYNLYSLVNGIKTVLTSFPSSIKYARVNANGGLVVFEKDYQLWLLNSSTKKTEKLGFSIVRNNVLLNENDYQVKGNITDFDVSPDGKKMAFVSRGELFVSDLEGKIVQAINKGNSERASEVKWLNDNRTLLYLQTSGGYSNLYTIEANGPLATKALAIEAKMNRSLVLNAKRTMGVYYSGRDEIKLIDLKTLTSKKLLNDEVWALRGNKPSFSPDDQYVLFTAYRNFEQDVFVHQLATGKTINLTNSGVSETDPLWAPDGRSIFFTSSRLKPSYPLGLQNPHIYKMDLQNFDSLYLTDKYNDLFNADTSKKKKSPNVVTTININRIMDRVEQVGPSFGNQELVAVLQKDDKTTVLFLSDQAEGKALLYKTDLKPFEEEKTEKISGSDGNGADVVVNGDKYYTLIKGTIGKLTLSETSNKVEPISINHTFRKNPLGEFIQVFEEAWAQVESNYYDEKFHGVDWKAKKTYYQQFLPMLTNRNDLRIMMTDLLGELNSSHTGFTSNGDEEKTLLNNTTLETGIVFKANDAYKVDYVLYGTPANKTNIDVQPRDELISVNGVAVDKAMDRYYYFTKPSPDKEVSMEFKRNGKTITVRLHPKTSLQNELYNEWIDRNKQQVAAKTNNTIAYACMKNMGTPELEKFLVHMSLDLQGKKGLILDLRYNTGGNVHDAVLQFLSQRSYLNWKYREGALTPQPNFAPSDNPIVLLINEQSLSDAEITAQGFKELKLGKIVGNETYRWIIFTSRAGLVDGSLVRLPSWGCYTLDGKDLEFTGVQPDIKVINTFEDRIGGKDPQLDRAIEEVLKGK